jgi:thiol-disulfide isomerase/thioredoxin
MTPSIRRLLPLAAVLLALAVKGLYRWSTSPAPAPVSLESAAIAGNGQPALVEFGMESCASCRGMHRVLDELRAADATRLRVIAVNVMQEPEATALGEGGRSVHWCPSPLRSRWTSGGCGARAGNLQNVRSRTSFPIDPRPSLPMTRRRFHAGQFAAGYWPET